MAKHLSEDERSYIMVWNNEWVSKREIWRRLGRHHDTITEEIKRNSVKWVYSSSKAKQKSYQRRKSCKKQIKKIRDCDELENYIHERMIQDKRSPQQVAAWWNKCWSNITISHETIYQYVYSNRWYTLREHLYTKRWKRKKKAEKVLKKELIKNRVRIDYRPETISKLLEFWHYECDLIMWPQWSKPCLLVLIEKYSRFKFVIKLESKSPEQVRKKLLEIIKKRWIKSITFDNWVEFKYHEQLWIPTYFCHPYHSREKWQVERGNRDIRKFYPKWTNFTNISQEEIDIVAKKINNTPMKCLKRKTPLSLFCKNIFSLFLSVGFHPWA